MKKLSLAGNTEPVTNHQSLVTSHQSPVVHNQSRWVSGFYCIDQECKKILTDSGGLQKEAYFSRVPFITLDEATGWPETVEDGWNILVGSDKNKIVAASRHFEPRGEQRDVFSDGRAAGRIVEILSSNSYN